MKKLRFFLKKEENKTEDTEKSELYNKIDNKLSESKWFVEREKKELREELRDILAETRWMIEKQANEINEQLLNEIKKLNEKTEQDKQDLYNKLFSKLLAFKSEILAKIKEKEKKENLNIVDRDLIKNNSHNEFPQPFISPPQFQKIKIKPLKPEINVLGLNLNKNNIKQNNWKKRESIGEYSKLPELPEMDYSDFKIEKIDLRNINSERKLETKQQLSFKSFDTQASPDFLLEKNENNFSKLEKADGKNNKQYVKEIKSAVSYETAIPKKIKEVNNFKLKKPRKEYLDYNDFKQSEEEINNIKKGVSLFEEDLNENVKKQFNEKKRFNEMIEDLAKTRERLSAINSRVFKKLNEN